MVMVVAVAMVSQAGMPTPWSRALLAMREYVERIDDGALR